MYRERWTGREAEGDTDREKSACSQGSKALSVSAVSKRLTDVMYVC